MIDLTGANLVAYLMRVVKDAVIRNPRFRNTIGEVTFASNNQIFWNDTQITIKSVATSGNRLSFDYFLCTQHGRAILAKVADKDGSFVEWVVETDKTRNTPKAGVYYFNVDAVDEQTRNVNLTVQQYRWEQGSITNAEGTRVQLRDGIDGTTVTPYDVSVDPVSGFGFNFGNGFGNAFTPVQFQAYNHFLFLLTPVKQLGLKQNRLNPVTLAPESIDLTPNVDFWIERKQSTVICQSTLGGQEVISIPRNVQSYDIVDQDGYTLRKGLDYYQQGPGFIVVSQFTPPAQTLSCVGVFNLDPSITIPASNPENFIPVAVGPNETVGEVIIQATSGNYNTAQVDPVTGNILLPVLLLPGENLRWEVRILTRNFTVVGKKYELNNFQETVWDPKAGGKDANTPAPGAYVPKLDLTTQQPINPIPGMSLAIGDSVVKGDQCAIIVNPELTETYEVFGSKENLNFVLEVKSNDYQTSSDLSSLIRGELLIKRRENMEADGVTLFEAAVDNQGEQRDPSGTAPRYIFNVTVSASADWKVFIPCITRMASFEINESTYIDGYAGKLSLPPRMQALGAFQFIPAYA